MKRPPATESSDCVLPHLLERSPLMRESAAQCYNHRLAYNLGKNAPQLEARSCVSIFVQVALVAV